MQETIKSRNPQKVTASKKFPVRKLADALVGTKI